MDFNAFLLPFGVYLLGVAGRIVLPYVYERVQSDGPLTFDARYLLGQALGAIMGLIPVWVAPDFAASLAGVSPGVVFGFGWFASDVGNRVISKPLVARNS